MPAIRVVAGAARATGGKRGAFTGAIATRAGHFREAAGRTLFLDEVHALPKATQVKLLRVLQEGEVLAIGSSRPIRTDARVIAAANVNLLNEAARGTFRGDSPTGCIATRA